MRFIGLAGWSGAGKTTLLAKIIPLLVARGLGVSTVKHAHHSFDVLEQALPGEKGAFQPVAKQVATGTKNPATEERWA